MRLDRSIFLFVGITSIAFAGFTFGCSGDDSNGLGANAGGDGAAADDDASDSIANGGDARARDDGSTGDASVSPTDAGADVVIPPFDASSLPPALQACGTCFSDTCEPEVSACAADQYCEDLLTCAITSGCVQSGGSANTCIDACATDAGLTAKETVEASKLLEQMVTACTGCVAQCPKPDGGP